MSFRIYDESGNEISLFAIGMRPLKMQVYSPSYESLNERVEGRSGVFQLQRTLLPREIGLKFFIEYAEHYRASERRDMIHEVFSKPVYLVERDNPNKRWKAKFDDSYLMERASLRVAHTEIMGICETGLAESITPVEEQHDTFPFTFRNEGNQKIDMCNQSQTILTFEGASTGLSITNTTTGDVWTYSGNTAAGDVITLQGVRSLKNGVSIFKDTNKQILTFSPGLNEIEVSGASAGSILTISTRFYFL